MRDGKRNESRLNLSGAERLVWCGGCGICARVRLESLTYSDWIARLHESVAGLLRNPHVERRPPRLDGVLARAGVARRDGTKRGNLLGKSIKTTRRVSEKPCYTFQNLRLRSQTTIFCPRCFCLNHRRSAEVSVLVLSVVLPRHPWA
jgi:hypothetical protein